jgi:DNA-binding beta-propeller fold protein YncE
MRFSIVLPVLMIAIATDVFAETKPVAMDWHDGGSLVVLSRPGEVAVYDVEHHRHIRVFPIASNIRPSDIVSAKIFNAETLFVSGFYGRQSVILQYSLEGKLLNRFNTPDLAAGMDVDPVAHVLYAASPVSRTVYAISLGGTDQRPRLLAFVGLARTLGPVIFDAPHKRLLVADTQAGDLYAIDCRTGSYGTLTNGLGGPVALAFNKTFSVLYVADYISGKVHVLRFSPARPPEAIETSLPNLSSVATAPADDTLFIADEERGVFLFLTKTRVKSPISGW